MTNNQNNWTDRANQPPQGDDAGSKFPIEQTTPPRTLR
jgi:hypothetical protein